jgi:hypothetical protein
VVRFPAGVGKDSFFLFTASRPVLVPIQAPIQWVPAVLSLGLKRSGLEADHSHLVRDQ